MKKWQLFIVSLLIMLFMSFDVAQAKSYVQQADNTTKLELIKEKRQIVKKHQKANEKLKKQVGRKSKQIDKALIELSESSVVPQKIIEEQLNAKLEGIMSQLMQIGDVESASWKHLNMANKQIEMKKYDAGIKNLDKTITSLETQHELLISFSTSMDELLAFVNSLKNK